MNDPTISRLDEVDPDYFDLIVQSLSVLSSVATLGSTWYELRKNQSRPNNNLNRAMMEEHLRQLDKSFDDVFHHLRTVLATLRQSYEVREHKELDDLKPRFGSGAVMLTQQEFASIQMTLNHLGNAANMARSHSLSLQSMLPFEKFNGEDRIEFDAADFNDDLNGVLFQSATFREAVDRLHSVENRAREFLSHARRAVRGN